ncbi:hypothetical protein [Alkalitalea saponilacus]|nr:hypothetical protein [Alkalitalea saponilacus]
MKKYKIKIEPEALACRHTGNYRLVQRSTGRTWQKVSENSNLAYKLS